MNRIVALLDMDCFYVQVEQRDRPETKGKPCAVIQYKGRGVLAVSYEARSFGIKRGMRGDAAMSLCPELILFTVPEKRGKAELTKYRAACSEIIQCILQFCKDVERASIDEAYIDLTDLIDNAIKADSMDMFKPMKPNSESFVVLEQDQADLTNAKPDCYALNQTDWFDFMCCRYTDGRRLALASALVYKIRQSIFSNTGFKCSAGIAPNKTLAKLACSLNKPNKQTVVPPESTSALLQSTPIRKIRNLGGKFGATVTERFQVETLGQLVQIPLSSLENEFGEKVANWLYDLCRGRDPETVVSRSVPQSVSCSKNFPGRDILNTSESIFHWLKCLAEELIERLVQDRQDYNRIASRLTLIYCLATESSSSSRVLPHTILQPIWTEVAHIEQTVAVKIAQTSLAMIRDCLYKEKPPDIWNPGITHLGLSAGKFVSEQSTSGVDIRSMFKNVPTPKLDHEPPVDLNKETEPDVAKPSDLSPISNPHIAKIDSSNSQPSVPPSTSNSFFKRLRVAEASNLHQSAPHSANQNHTAFNSIEVSSDQSSHQTSADPTYPVPDLDLDNESRSSSTTSDTFFTSYSAGDWVVCDQCHSRVSVWQLPEHSDFHFAQRLQQEWSDARDQPSSSTAKAVHPKPLTQCSRGRTTKNNKPKVNRGPTLDNFIVRLPSAVRKPD